MPDSPNRPVRRTLTFEVNGQGEFTYTKTPSNIPPGDDPDTFSYGRFDLVSFQTQAGPFTVDLQTPVGVPPILPKPWPLRLESGQNPEGPSRMFRTPTVPVVNPERPGPIATYSYVITGTDPNRPFSDDSAEGDFAC